MTVLENISGLLGYKKRDSLEKYIRGHAAQNVQTAASLLVLFIVLRFFVFRKLGDYHSRKHQSAADQFMGGHPFFQQPPAA